MRAMKNMVARRRYRSRFRIALLNAGLSVLAAASGAAQEERVFRPEVAVRNED
jgi:hypothetical protein